MNDSKIYFEQISVGTYRNFCYLLADNSTSRAAIFDPAWQVDSLCSILREKNLDLQYIINTHAHLDHIQGNPEMKTRTGAKIIMHESSFAVKDIGVHDNSNISIGDGISLNFIHTPGHSPESMCIQINDSGLITGDTLFIGECGRVDLPGGDANLLFDSFQKLRSLNRSLVVFPGHDYGDKPSSTLGEQFKSNYTLQEMTREEFVKFMRT
jgi:hydroxyacylglutathione hydrolase